MNNKDRYNKIMRSVSKEVKNILNKDILKFDVTGYEDDKPVDYHTLSRKNVRKNK